MPCGIRRNAHTIKPQHKKETSTAPVCHSNHKASTSWKCDSQQKTSTAPVCLSNHKTSTARKCDSDPQQTSTAPVWDSNPYIIMIHMSPEIHEAALASKASMHLLRLSQDGNSSTTPSPNIPSGIIEKEGP